MARARTLKPGFFKNDLLADCEMAARILFQGLWCFCDREGRIENRPKILKAEILPYDDCDIPNLLLQLAAAGFIICYTVDDRQFIQVVNFTKHQNPHPKEAKSEIPPPSIPEMPRRDTEEPRQDVASGAGSQPIDIVDAAESREKTRLVPEKPERATEFPERAGPITFSLLPSPKERLPPTEVVVAPSADALASAVEDFNQVAKRCGLPMVAKLTEARRNKLRARLRQHGAVGWSAALRKLEAIPWMHGTNDRGWRADFDFLLQDKSFNRLIEGSYDRDAATGNDDVSERLRPLGPPPALPEGWAEKLKRA